MAHQILIDQALDQWILDLFSDDCQLHLWSEASPEVMREIVGCFIYSHPTIDGAFMDSLPQLKVISNFGVGVDHIDLDAAKERGIPVGNTPNLLDGATADMAFALLMATARNLFPGERYAHSPQFAHYDPNILLGREVHSSTMGIVGLGNIGFQLARRAQGFDMQVIYHNRNPNPRAESELGAVYVPFDELLQRADYVCLTVPLTPQTHHLIGRRELELMREDAFLINVARGGVVDHDALLHALQEKQIAGAGLDVTEPEPLPRDHPLLEQDNAVIVPHLGSATVQTRLAMAQRTVDNLNAVLAGGELITRVA